MKQALAADGNESVAPHQPGKGTTEDRSGLTAGWMLACLSLVTALLGSVSSSAGTTLISFVNPNDTAGLAAWTALFLFAWLGLRMLLRWLTRRSGFHWNPLLQIALLTFGFTAVGLLLLGNAPRFQLLAQSFPGSGASGQIVVFGLAGLAISVCVWFMQFLLVRAPVSRGESHVRALPIGFALVSVYFLVLSQWAPSGVTAVFTQRTWLVLLLVSLVLHFAVGLLYGHDRGVFRWRTGDIRWRWSDAAFVIVPVTPVASYMVVNREYLTPITALFLLVVVAAALFVLVAVVPKMVAGSSDPRVVMAIAAGGAFTLTVMAALSRSQAWFGVGSWTYQVLVLVAATGVLLAFTMPPPRVLLVAALIFATFQISLAAVNSESGVVYLEEATAEQSSLIDSGQWDEPLDIIVLIYESYVNEETMNAYGIDNSAQMAFLSEQGFTIYDGTYSNGAWSLASMSRFLNASTALGPQDVRRYTAGHAQVPQLLSEKGYSTAGIYSSDYYFGTHEPQWDYSLPDMTQGSPETWIPLASGILRGEFRSDASFNSIDYDTYLATKRDLMDQESESPLFLYTHNVFPNHSQNSGQCLPNETELYIDLLEIGNEEMRVDVETVVSSRPNAVVVIAGDHGPYLTKNCTYMGGLFDVSEIDRLDIQDRYGTFLAIRWPENTAPDYDIEVLQEVMPAVLAYVSEEDAYWNDRAVERVTVATAAGPVRVERGLIQGGMNDGEPLFLQRGRR